MTISVDVKTTPKKPNLDHFILSCEKVNATETAALATAVLGSAIKQKEILSDRARQLGIKLPSTSASGNAALPQLGRVQKELTVIRGAFLVRLAKTEHSFSSRELGIVLMNESRLSSSAYFDFLSQSPVAKVHGRPTMTPDQFQQRVGERIAEVRTAKRIKREDLATAIGMSTVSVGRLETGKQRIASSLLYVIAEGLGVSVRELLPKKAALPGRLSPAQEIDDATLDYAEAVINKIRKAKAESSKRAKQ